MKKSLLPTPSADLPLVITVSYQPKQLCCSLPRWAWRRPSPPSAPTGGCCPCTWPWPRTCSWPCTWPCTCRSAEHLAPPEREENCHLAREGSPGRSLARDLGELQTSPGLGAAGLDLSAGLNWTGGDTLQVLHLHLHLYLYLYLQ